MLKIIMDDRECGEVFNQLINLKVNIQVKRLKVGDYVYKEICFERKTIKDLWASIIDGRFEHQVKAMQKNFNTNVILLSGRTNDVEPLNNQTNHSTTENVILGSIVSLVMKYKFFILWVEDDKQVAFVIKRVCERYDEEKLKEQIGEKLK